MAAARHKYSMQCRIRYNGKLVDVLDRIRAIRMVVMVHIEQDLGDDLELVTLKIMTAYPPRESFKIVKRLSVGKIETLREMQLLESTLTKLS
jgi:hypothetical protein